MTKKPITIIDIAKLLGVSKSTVSRALKDHPDISTATKEAVHMLAEELNYKPNNIAMSFRNNKSKVIGLIVPHFSPFFFPSVIEAIEKEINKRGYNLMIMQSNESYENEKHNLDILLSNNAEGFLISVSRKTIDYSHFQTIINNQIPIVFFDRVPNHLKADMVLIDDISGAYKAVEYLFQRGNKKIAICLGDPNLLITRNRLKGYKKALEHHNIEVQPHFIISGESTEEAEQKALELLSSQDNPDAILAISDLTMSGIMRAVYKLQLRIPEDLSIIGFCEEPFSLMYNPQLSVVDPMASEIGKVATERLFQRIHEGNLLETTTINLPSRLIIRKSTL